MNKPARPGNILATIQLVAAIASAVAARWFAPTIETPARHAEFTDFFAAAASVIAALLIALAVEARQAVGSKFLVTLSAITLAVGVISAVAALSPDLSAQAYRWLFATTVGGGVGGLVAALVVGAQTLAAEIDETRMAEVEKFFQRAVADSKRDQTGV